MIYCLHGSIYENTMNTSADWGVFSLRNCATGFTSIHKTVKIGVLLRIYFNKINWSKGWRTR